MAYSAEFVQAVKDKLHVTYSDLATDRRIESSIMPAAEGDLRSLLGIGEDRDGFTFETEGTVENELFLNHCWYAWNDASDDFEENYAAKIARCRMKWAGVDYAAQQEAGEL